MNYVFEWLVTKILTWEVWSAQERDIGLSNLPLN